MDKQREDFEAWVREHGNYPRRPELKTSDGAYHYLHTESEWRAWQAAQAAQPAHHLPEAGNMVAQPAQADLQAAFAKGMACRPASAQMPAEPGEKAQPMCTPEEAARICSTLGPVPDGKTWAQHMVDTARAGWQPLDAGVCGE